MLVYLTKRLPVLWSIYPIICLRINLIVSWQDKFRCGCVRLFNVDLVLPGTLEDPRMRCGQCIGYTIDADDSTTRPNARLGLLREFSTCHSYQSSAQRIGDVLRFARDSEKTVDRHGKGVPVWRVRKSTFFTVLAVHRGGCGVVHLMCITHL
jgi:hypothetical protein